MIKNLIWIIVLVLLHTSSVYGQSSSGLIKGTFVRATIDYTALTNSFAVLLTNTRKLTKCTFVNSTNAAISWDDGTTVISDNQAPLSKEYEDFGSNGRYINTNIRVKYIASAPTEGNVYINCYY